MGKKKLEHKEEVILEVKALKGAYSCSVGVSPLRLGGWMGAWTDKTSYISSIRKDTGQGL